MSNSDEIEHYLATQTQWPLDDVTDIYRAGAPWPIIFKELARMAEQDALATGVPVETVTKVLDQLCDLEGAHLKALVEQAQYAVSRVGRTVPFLDIPEVQAITDRSVMRDVWRYSERVAIRVGGTEPVKVFAIYLVLLQFAWEHPDWAG